MQIKEENKTGKICVVSYPYPPMARAWMHLFKLTRIIEPLFEKLYIVTGNIPEDAIPEGKFRFINFRMEPELKRHLWRAIALPIWYCNFISGQIKTCYYLIKISGSVDTVLFFSGADINLVPLLLSKLLRKKILTMIVEYSPLSMRSNHGVLPYYLFKLLSILNRLLSDRIIVFADNMIQWAKLEKYAHKTSVTGMFFIDTDLFQIKIPHDERQNTIGYAGRLTAEKGILDFIYAIPLILRHRSDVDFLIVGDGLLSLQIREGLKKKGLLEKVTLTDWIPHDEVADYMNQLKLLVVPTYTEAGSPQVIQEAMACGTPVLATMVAGIGDIIKDKESGFILRDRSPLHIAEDVLKILEYPHIDKIIHNGRRLIEQEYSFEAVAERFNKVFVGTKDGNNH